VNTHLLSDDRAGQVNSRRRTRRVVGAALRRDVGLDGVFRAGALLDLVYGVLNLLLFLFISRVLHHPGQQGLGGSATYFDFVAVGIAFMVVTQVVCTQFVNRVQEERTTGTLEALAAMPVPPSAIALGMVAYPLLMGLARSVVYLVVGCLLIGVQPGSVSWLGAAVCLIFGGLAASALGVLFGAFSLVSVHGQAASRLLLVALSFLSGAYFPVTALPGLLEPLTTVLPTRLAIDGLRAAIAGRPWLSPAGWVMLTAAVLLPIALWAFSRAISRSIRKGTLARG
jgi:ABC-2 type transport system permease protein